MGTSDLGDSPSNIASGTITALNGAVEIDCDGMAAVGVQVTGTFVSTQIFEGTLNGTDWLALRAYPSTGVQQVSSISTTGLILRVATGGFSRFRVRSSAYTSGTVSVYLRASVGPQIVLGTSENENNNLVSVYQPTTSYTRISTSSTTVVKSAAGFLYGATINKKGTGSASITIYDNTSAAAPIIATIDTVSPASSLSYGLHFSTGLTVVSSSNVHDVTLIWR